MNRGILISEFRLPFRAWEKQGERETVNELG
jgi:hypothetical protein